MNVDSVISWLTAKPEVSKPVEVPDPAIQEKVEGVAYCRFPALNLHNNKILLAFCSAGALWAAKYKEEKFSKPRKLTDSCSEVSRPVISPDSKKIAYCSRVNQIFEIAVKGRNAPKLLTSHGTDSYPVKYLPDGSLIYATNDKSSFVKTFRLYIRTKNKTEPIGLSSAHEIAFSDDNKTIFFTRYKGADIAKRYHGGSIKDIWSYSEEEAVCSLLTEGLGGHCFNPMFWNRKLYFLRHFEGVTNLFSMDPNGGNVEQKTFFKDFDIQEASLANGYIAFRKGVQIHLFFCDTEESRKFDFSLTDDAELARDRWIDNPEEYLTNVSLSPSGKKILMTCRGQLFLAHVEKNKPILALTGPSDIRYRQAKFIGESEDIIAISDKEGEQAFWKIFKGKQKKLSKDIKARVLHYSISSCGKYLFCYLWRNRCQVIDTRTKETLSLSLESEEAVFSPDSKRIAIEAKNPKNRLSQIFLYDLAANDLTPVTSDQRNSYCPRWSDDSRHLFFISDRHFNSQVKGGWKLFGQGAHFPKMGQVCHLPLARPFTSWFETEDNPGEWDLEGVFSRIETLSEKPQKIRNIFVAKEHFYALFNRSLQVLEKADREKGWKEIYPDVGKAILSENKKQILIVDKKGKHHVVLAKGKKEEKKTFSLEGWKFKVSPKREWRQRFEEAWRNQRDLFYDRMMHQIDWDAMRMKYLPMLESVASNEELNDLISQMLGELGALHHFVREGDTKRSEPMTNRGFLGAAFEKCAHGFKITRIFHTDPDDTTMRSPLRTFDQKFREGDIITKINGTSWESIGEALTEMKGKKVALTLKNGKTHEVQAHDRNKEITLLHDEWVYQNRQKVAELSNGRLGYVQMRNMSGDGLNDFHRQFYPQNDKKGMILDFRHNRGGNIDHLILEKLLKRRWMQMRDRHGFFNNFMVDAFDGSLVALCDDTSYSDAEYFLLAFQKFKLGTVVGTKTWGGGVWLISSLGKAIDNALATIPNFGCYDKYGNRLIENRGVVPDIEVKNDPRREFLGHDDVLERGVGELLKQIEQL